MRIEEDRVVVVFILSDVNHIDWRKSYRLASRDQEIYRMRHKKSHTKTIRDRQSTSILPFGIDSI